MRTHRAAASVLDPDPDAATRQIDVSPAQRACLADAQAGEHEGRDQHPARALAVCAGVSIQLRRGFKHGHDVVRVVEVVALVTLPMIQAFESPGHGDERVCDQVHRPHQLHATTAIVDVMTNNDHDRRTAKDVILISTVATP
jgi:hypothetical protein